MDLTKNMKENARHYVFLVIFIILVIVAARDWKNAVKGAKDGWNENHSRVQSNK